MVVLQTKSSTKSVTGDGVGLEYYAKKYINFFVQNDNGTVSLDLTRKTRGNTSIEEQDIEVMQQYDKMLNTINSMVENGTLYIADDGNYYFADNYATRTIVGGKNDFYIRTQSILWVPVPVGYYFSLSMAVSVFFVAGIDILARHLDVLWSSDSLMGYFKSIYNDEQVANILNSKDGDIQKIKEILQSIVDGKYSTFVNILGCIPIVSDIISLLITFSVSWIYGNVVSSMQTKIKENIALSNSNNTIIMTSDLLLGGRNFSVATK